MPEDTSRDMRRTGGLEKIENVCVAMKNLDEEEGNSPRCSGGHRRLAEKVANEGTGRKKERKND